MFKKYWPHLLVLVYFIFLFSCYSNNSSFNDYLDKNIIPILIVATFVILYIKNIRFSNIGYTLAIVFPFINVLSSYYGVGDATTDVFNNTITVQGDIFEKLGHFSAGFYAYPIIGILIRTGKIKSKWLASLFAVGLVGFITMDYEIIEIFTDLKNGALDVLTVSTSTFGILYVRGDIFIGALGAIFAAILFLIFNKDKYIENKTHNKK